MLSPFFLLLSVMGRLRLDFLSNGGSGEGRGNGESSREDGEAIGKQNFRAICCGLGRTIQAALRPIRFQIPGERRRQQSSQQEFVMVEVL